MDLEQRMQRETILHKNWYEELSPKNFQDNREPAIVNRYISVQSYWRWIFMTVFVLSKVFLLFAIYFYIKYKDAEFENKKIRYQIESKNR